MTIVLKLYYFEHNVWKLLYQLNCKKLLIYILDSYRFENSNKSSNNCHLENHQ